MIKPWLWHQRFQCGDIHEEITQMIGAVALVSTHGRTGTSLKDVGSMEDEWTW